MKRFKKAPAHKTLTLFVGNGDKRIMDGEVLEGAYWQKFADQGFLVPVEDDDVTPIPAPVKAAAPAKAPEPKPEPEPAPEPKKTLDRAVEAMGTMTRSGADKMATAQGDKGRSASTKGKGKRRKK